MDIWGWLWIAWILLFFVIEGTALITDHIAGTLSDHFRLWFRTDTKPGRTIWLVVSGVFGAWFIVHICASGIVWPW